MTHNHEYIPQQMSHDRLDEPRRLAREMNIRKQLAKPDHKNKGSWNQSLDSLAQWLIRSVPRGITQGKLKAQHP
ncbi:MAG: hypothetical protein MUO76_06180 [Anaerolineaceae bacterium]|nr:hypothetical protein [Anaerolineaceae bacterium]